MKVGVNGAVRDISDLKVGANGAVRAVSEAYIGVNGAVKKVWPLIPIGYQVILDTVGSGTWVCPASGNWEVELHGGGGGGGGGGLSYAGAGGGGSGELYTVNIACGQQMDYSIGKGGVRGRGSQNTSNSTSGYAGGATSFGLYSIDGGGGAGAGAGPSAHGGTNSGSLSGGGSSGGSFPGAGGIGNTEKIDQTYGSGGRGGVKRTPGVDGYDGAIILTYLG